MDKLTNYRTIIKKIIHYHAQFRASHGVIDSIAVCDETSDNYMVLTVGWDRTGRVHGMPIHVRIIDEQFHIEWDGTEYGVGQELMDAGVPREDIKLAFYHHENPAYAQFKAMQKR